MTSKRGLALVAVVALALVVYFVRSKDTTEPADSEPTPTNAPGTPTSTATTSDTPTTASPGATTPSATENADPFGLETPATKSIREKLLASVDETFRKRITFRMTPQGADIYVVQTLLDGVRVDRADLRARRSGADFWQTDAVETSKWNDPGAFPAANEADLARFVEMTLERDGAREITVGFIEKSWSPTEHGLVPTFAYRVDATSTEGHPVRELWRVDVRNEAIVSRDSRGRF